MSLKVSANLRQVTPDVLAQINAATAAISADPKLQFDPAQLKALLDAYNNNYKLKDAKYGDPLKLAVLTTSYGGQVVSPFDLDSALAGRPGVLYVKNLLGLAKRGQTSRVHRVCGKTFTSALKNIDLKLAELKKKYGAQPSGAIASQVESLQNMQGRVAALSAFFAPYLAFTSAGSIDAACTMMLSKRHLDKFINSSQYVRADQRAKLSQLKSLGDLYKDQALISRARANLPKVQALGIFKKGGHWQESLGKGQYVRSKGESCYDPKWLRAHPDQMLKARRVARYRSAHEARLLGGKGSYQRVAGVKGVKNYSYCKPRAQGWSGYSGRGISLADAQAKFGQTKKAAAAYGRSQVALTSNIGALDAATRDRILANIRRDGYNPRPQDVMPYVYDGGAAARARRAADQYQVARVKNVTGYYQSSKLGGHRGQSRAQRDALKQQPGAQVKGRLYKPSNITAAQAAAGFKRMSQGVHQNRYDAKQKQDVDAAMANFRPWSQATGGYRAGGQNLGAAMEI
jgi:hypothetical protein